MIPVANKTNDPDSVSVGVYGAEYVDGRPQTVTIHFDGWELDLSRDEADKLAEAIDLTLKGWAE